MCILSFFPFVDYSNGSESKVTRKGTRMDGMTKGEKRIAQLNKLCVALMNASKVITKQSKQSERVRERRPQRTKRKKGLFNPENGGASE